MEGLLAEINAKRKALEVEAGPSDGPAKKYMRRADIEKAREEEERKKRMEDAVRKEALKAEGKAYKARKEAEQARNSSLAKLAVSSPGGSSRNTPDPGRTDSPAPAGESFNISPEECIRRLRAKGQPIRLFGESDKDRRLRLRALELLEEKGGGGSGLNDFRKTLANMESSMDEKEAGKLARLTHEKAAAEASKQQTNPEDGPAEEEKETSGKSKDKMKGMEVALIDLKLVKSDPNKLYPLIYYALKNVLKEWEEWMDARPVEIKRTTAGKLAAATQVDSAQNLKPLFRLLRKRDLPADVLRNLAEIVHHMQNRSYQKANDAYLRMSIGNAAWPIGVTSVGIHERSAREKIGQDNIAHALNSEENRKYIQAVKRLLTFSQTVRPPSEISQLMG